jgi:hypothetical protein
MEKYRPLIKAINIEIDKFNLFLKKKYCISLLNENDLSNDEFYTNLINTKWEDQHWPNSEKSGVYFIFGFNEENKSEFGLHIGKASMSSTIGRRLYVHLKQYHDKKDYLMGDGKGKIYILELISSITLEDKKIKFMTTSLKEFLIDKLREKRGSINLINVFGNN